MPDFNPYAAPRADIEPVYIAEVIPQELAPGAWRMGYLLVMTGDGILPQRCAMTNQEMVNYDNSMVGFMGRNISIPVSQQYLDNTTYHKTVSRSLQIVGVIAILVGMGLINPALNFRLPSLLIATAILIVAGLPAMITGIIWQRSYVPSLEIEHFTPQLLWLRGAHPDYLASLPEWPYGGWRQKRM